MSDSSDLELNERVLLKRQNKKQTESKRNTLEAFHETSETEMVFHEDQLDDDVHDDDDENSIHVLDQPSSGSTPKHQNDNEDDSQTSKETGLKGRFRRLRKLAGAIVNNEHFQLFIIFLIIVNAIMMGVATFDFVQDDEERKQRFERTDRAFLIVFTIELAMQLLYHGIYLFTDAWLVFDFVIVVISWAFDSMQIIRAFRIFRALRLITRLEVLRTLVVALFAVMPRMTAISALLLLVIYIYGVLCTYLFKDLFSDGDTDEDYFSRLDLTFFTLFQIMTLEDWGVVARQVMEVHGWAWMVFVSYVAITSFIVYNLIIAVVCDAVAVREHDHDVDVPPQPTSDKQSIATQECQKKVFELNERVEILAHQQQQLLKAVQDACKELESMDEEGT